MPSIDQALERFEQDWNLSKPPSIAEYVHFFGIDDKSTGLELLIELICIDIEYRWKRSRRGAQGLVLDDYYTTHPELGVLRDTPMMLVEEEYRARQLWGDNPSHSIYVKRFGERNGEVERALQKIDDEIGRESFCVSEVGRIGQRVIREPSLPTFAYTSLLLQQMIGFGHMGRVYRATNKVDGQTVAVKFLRRAFCRDAAAVDRFLREARIVHGLKNPGIVRVDGVGTTPNAGHFLVMEMLKGPDLASVIDREQIAIHKAVEWTIQAAHAIAFANESGILHCDLKPGNLVLDLDGNVKITDFGLAISIDEKTDVLDRIAGTAPFMAPEQVSDCWGEVGRHTDAYGLGAVLYTLLTGRPPYTGRSAVDILTRVVSGQEPPRPEILREEISLALSDVVGKALSKNPGRRFKTAKDVAVALRQLSDCAGCG